MADHSVAIAGNFNSRHAAWIRCICKFMAVPPRARHRQPAGAGDFPPGWRTHSVLLTMGELNLCPVVTAVRSCLVKHWTHFASVIFIMAIRIIFSAGMTPTIPCTSDKPWKGNSVEFILSNFNQTSLYRSLSPTEAIIHVFIIYQRISLA
jgi:hypothetical protein